jgi:hypothetical protein
MRTREFKLCRILENNKFYARKDSKIAKLWRLIMGATLNIFQCRLLYWVSEEKQNIVEPVIDQFYVLLMYF